MSDTACRVGIDKTTPKPRRKNLRMQGWDFTSPGWYFLAICTKNMRPAFGTVVNGHMVLNAAGKVAEKFWREIPAHFARAIVDEYVVMPNHVHGLLRLADRSTACRGPVEAFGRPVAGSVPTIVRSYIEDGRGLAFMISCIRMGSSMVRLRFAEPARDSPLSKTCAPLKGG